MMNLLPKSHEQFSQTDYWDSFFKKRGKKAFEWYGEYPELSDHLHKYIKTQDNVLITGCGNSTLGRDLFDIGYKNITNIDISQVVIKQMQDVNKSRPNLKYLHMDALNTSFNNEEFTVILDKGTLDALMPDDKEDTIETILKYFTEIQRLLKVGGRYVCISLLQEHILRIILQYFPENNWMFRAVRCFQAERKAEENGESPMPVFMIICTKFLKLPNKILELNMGTGDKMMRLQKITDVVDHVTSAQQAAFVCSGLKRTSLSDEAEVSFDLYSSSNSKPRFTVHIVDSSLVSKRNLEYAAFLVPQGREAEWIFSTKAGRKHLLEVSKKNRLAIITLHRGQQYGTFESVQNELGDTVRTFSPASYTNKKIPFLSLGAEVGSRIIKYEGKSDMSGEYVIEDVQVDNEKYRRLYYLSSQLVIQSEAKLKSPKNKKGNLKETVDLTYITCKHHIYMSIGAHLSSQDENCSLAVIGLGGGGLCSFLRRFLPKANIIGIDIDKDMLQIATEWFGFKQDSNLRAEIKDGIEFLRESACAGAQFDSVLFDVDSKDTTIGMSCPPKQFLDLNVLNNVLKILKPNGLFILNLVLRDQSLRNAIIKDLKNVFKAVFCYQLCEDLNEVIFCIKQTCQEKEFKDKIVHSTTELNKFFKKFASNNEQVDVSDYINNIRMNC